MKLFARELPLAPHPLELARRLGSEDPLVVLWSADGRGPSFLAVRPRGESNALDPEPALARAAEASRLAQAPRWIGLLPYEARRELERSARVPFERRPAPQLERPVWWRFGAVVRVDLRVTVIGDDAGAVDDLCALLSRARPQAPAPVELRVLPGESLERHGARISAALELIAAGQIYQVNLARRLDLHVGGAPLDVLDRLCRQTRPPYAAAFRFGDHSVISSSPELLLRCEADGRLLTSPIKGTRPRGLDAESDARLARELDSDPKERAELSMIVDVERNDLGRVSQIGTVRLRAEPTVSSAGFVWHRHAHVVGRLRQDVDRQTLLEAVVPSGSVTGAPKVRAMEIIASLEAERRGLYTGGMGFISHAGEITLAMAIRTLCARGNEGHYFVGGGIVADSQPSREIEETGWKARQLFARSG